MLDLVSLLKLFVSGFQLFLELFVLFLESVVFLVKVFFLLLDTSFLTGKLVSSLLDLFFKLGAALVYLVLSFNKSDLLFAVGFLFSRFDNALSLLFGGAYSGLCLSLAVIYARLKADKARNSRSHNKYDHINGILQQKNLLFMILKIW